MGKYKVSFKREGNPIEYGIVVEANNLGEAETGAVREIIATHQKGFLGPQEIVKIEQII